MRGEREREREAAKGKPGWIVYISTRIPLTLWTGDALLPTECGSVAFSYWTRWIKRERLPVYRRNTIHGLGEKRTSTYGGRGGDGFSEYFSLLSDGRISI